MAVTRMSEPTRYGPSPESPSNSCEPITEGAAGGGYFFLFARPKNILAHCDADEIASLFRVVEIADEPPDTQHPDVGGPFTIVKSSLEFHRLRYF